MFDIEKIRKDFPMLNEEVKMQGKKLVYLDNASTTFKPQCVIDAINNYYTHLTANSHRGDYDLCFNMDKTLIETRKVIANFVNCDDKEVVFTSGATMALNMVAYCYGSKFIKKGDEIIIDENEHASNVLPWYQLAKRTGAIIKLIPLTDKGEITIENLKKVLTNNTKLVSLAAVTNVLGAYIDIKEFAKVIHNVGAVFCVDGAQSVPHIKTDFKDSDIDFLCFSAHKMCGPTGVGALIGKFELLQKMDPFILGGGMNISFDKKFNYEPYDAPMKFEAGTLNLAGIVGFKAAVEYIESIGIENIHQHDIELHEYLVSKLKDFDDIIIYNKDIKTGTLIFNRKNVFAQDEATLLNYKGIAVRSGQHCAKILNDFLGCEATCRVSTYLYTTKAEIDYFIQVLQEKGDILDAFFN